MALDSTFRFLKVATSSEAPNGFHPYASFGIGMASGIVYIACSCALKHFRFDDVVDSVAGIQYILPMISTHLKSGHNRYYIFFCSSIAFQNAVDQLNCV